MDVNIQDHIQKRISATESSFLHFFNIAGSHDLNSAYRGRPIWAKCKVDELVQPASVLLTEAPSSRSAVLYFISNLVHENVHNYFISKEMKDGHSPSRTLDNNLEEAIKILVEKLDNLRVGCHPKSSFSIILLNWLFELFSDLWRQNHNRPYFNHQRPLPITLLRAFQKIPSISNLLTLLQTTFTSLMNSAPEKAIHTFIIAHKTYFNNFEWIKIYIADSFPPDIINQLIKMGADEFQLMCSESNRPNMHRNIQHEDYAGKLRLFSDIFQYMENNRRIELRHCFISIVAKFMETGDNLFELVFFIKLILSTPELVLPFVDELIKLVIDPRLVNRLNQLVQTQSFTMAISHPQQLQNFFAKVLERASTNSIFNLIEFIGPLIH